MSGYKFTFQGAELFACPSGALWWPDQRLLCVSDLHFGKADRYARKSRGLLPPYEVRETLSRLEEDISRLEARKIICLGDSWDDLEAADRLPEDEKLWLIRLMSGRQWYWIEGNHDPGPIELAGTHLAVLKLGPLTFRHIAEPKAEGEISGHYHPKARLANRSQPVFLLDKARLILPAYGTYTGGLRSTDPALVSLMGPETLALVTGKTVHAIPMPR